jgi:hypothetical protein
MHQTLTAFGLAFARLGIRASRPRPKSWPRNKGPVGTRIDTRTGFAVDFVRRPDHA